MLRPGQILTTFKTKKDREVVIRGIDKNDLKMLMEFINPIISEDTFIIRMPGDEVKLAEEKVFLKEQIKKLKKKESVYLIAVYNNRIVGSTNLSRGISRAKHTGDIGIAISLDFREEGLGRKLLELLFIEATKIGLKQLSLTCLANNTGAIHVYEKLGFTKVGLLPKAYEFKGEYVDSVLMYKEI